MLSDILLDISNEEGTRVGVGETDRDVTIFYVNKAAREIWKSHDLDEWMEEGVFDINVSSQMVAFPEVLGRPRGLRYMESRIDIEIYARRNRYNRQTHGENEAWPLRWRNRGYSAISRNIENASRLICSIPESDTADFNLTVTGSNENISKIVETLSFPIGTTSVESSNIFDSVFSLVKTNRTKWNITIKDPEENTLAIIPNDTEKSQYIVMQILDTEDSQTADQSAVEIYYKMHYHPLQDDHDSFFNTDEYDDAIVAKYMELTKKDTKDKSYYRALCADLINKCQADKKIGEQERINKRVSPWFNQPYRTLGAK